MYHHLKYLKLINIFYIIIFYIIYNDKNKSMTNKDDMA